MTSQGLPETTWEHEVRFLEVDCAKLMGRLKLAKATDLGEKLIREEIYYDKDLKWRLEKRFVRVRTSGRRTSVSYKRKHTHTVSGTEEIEFQIADVQSFEQFLKALDMTPFRRQEKKRWTWTLGQIRFDFDTWPGIPCYLEIEASSSDGVQQGVALLELDMALADTHDAAWVIENVYNIPVRSLRDFVFPKPHGGSRTEAS